MMFRISSIHHNVKKGGGGGGVAFKHGPVDYWRQLPACTCCIDAELWYRRAVMDRMMWRCVVLDVFFI